MRRDEADRATPVSTMTGPFATDGVRRFEVGLSLLPIVSGWMHAPRRICGDRSLGPIDLRAAESTGDTVVRQRLALLDPWRLAPQCFEEPGGVPRVDYDVADPSALAPEDDEARWREVEPMLVPHGYSPRPHRNWYSPPPHRMDPGDVGEGDAPHDPRADAHLDLGRGHLETERSYARSGLRYSSRRSSLFCPNIGPVAAISTCKVYTLILASAAVGKPIGVAGAAGAGGRSRSAAATDDCLSYRQPLERVPLRCPSSK